jgi:RNA polymerase sigma factor (sigma-70 family)
VTDVSTLPDENDVRMRDGLVAGAEHALAEVYDAFAPVVFGIALQITRDRGIAEDVTQEVFVELWRHPDRFDPHRAPLRGWLCLIARRRAIDRVRSYHAEAARLSVVLEPPPAGFEDDLVASTAYKQVRQAVEDLPAPHRQAIELAYYVGLSYREVARVLHIPEGTAKGRIRTALRRVGDQLAAEGFEHDTGR